MIDEACECGFFFIRHGQTVANRDGVRSGAESDTHLTELGREQARRAGMALDRLGVKPGLILPSPLSRTIETAELLNARFGLEMRIEPGLIERRLGSWNGPEHRGDPAAARRGPHATRRRIQCQVHGAGARRLPRPRAALRAMAPDRLQPRRRPGADGARGLRGCRHGAELYDPARHPRGFGRRRRLRGRRGRPSRNRSRPRLIPLRPYSVMVFFRSSFPRKRESRGFRD